MQLWVDDAMAWEEDIAPTRQGHEWVSLDVTTQALADARFRVRFRVTDKRGVGDYATVTFLGPLRLRTSAD
jgi:hypothetical protein